MNRLLIVILGILIFSFINNLLITFDNLQQLTNEQEETAFLKIADPTIESGQSYIKTIGKYIIYFIFFDNIDNLEELVRGSLT